MRIVKMFLMTVVMMIMCMSLSYSNVTAEIKISPLPSFDIIEENKVSVLDRYNNSKTVAIVDKNITTDHVLIDVLNNVDALYIKHGIGGSVFGMIQLLMYLDFNPNKTIVIDGECASACTMLLYASDNVIFTENAKFQFHSSFELLCDNGKYLPKMNDDVNNTMLKVYPKPIREWIIENDAFGSIDFVEIDNILIREMVSNMFVDKNKLNDLIIDGDMVITDNNSNLSTIYGKSCEVK